MTGQRKGISLPFEGEMTITKTDILVKADSVSIYGRWKAELEWMAKNTHIHQNDLLAEAMRDGLTECKTQTGINRFLSWQKKYENAKDYTGKSFTVGVDWSPVEFEALERVRKAQDPELTEVAFVSRSFEIYFKRWAVDFAKGKVHPSLQEPPPQG